MESIVIVSSAVIVALVSFLSLCLHCRKPPKTKEEIMQKRFRKFSKHHMIPTDKLARRVDIIRPTVCTEHVTPPLSLCDSEHQYEQINEDRIGIQPLSRPSSECSFLDESFQTVIQNAGVTSLPVGQMNNLNIPPSGNNLSSSRVSYISFHQSSQTFLHNASTGSFLEQSSLSEESNGAASPSSIASPVAQTELPIMKPLNWTYLAANSVPRIVVMDQSHMADATSDSVFIHNEDNTSIVVKTPKSKSIGIHLVADEYPNSSQQTYLSPRSNLTSAAVVDQSYESINAMPRRKPLKITSGLAKSIPRCSDHTYESVNDELHEELGRGDFTDMEYTDRTRNGNEESMEDNTYESLRGDGDFTTYEMCEERYTGTNFMNTEVTNMDATNITNTSPIHNHYESVESLRSHFEQIGRQRNVYRDKNEDRYSPFPVSAKLTIKRCFNATPNLSLMKSISGNLKMNTNQPGDETGLKTPGSYGVNAHTEPHVPEQIVIYTPTLYTNHGTNITLELETPIKTSETRDNNSDESSPIAIHETRGPTKQNEYMQMLLAQDQNTRTCVPDGSQLTSCSTNSPSMRRLIVGNQTTGCRNFTKPVTPSQAIAKSFLAHRDVKSPLSRPSDQGLVRLTQPKPWGCKKSLPSLPDYIQDDINMHFSNELYVSTPYMFMSPVFNLPATEI